MPYNVYELPQKKTEKQVMIEPISIKADLSEGVHSLLHFQ